jgi:anti-anti-sigma regulatory factor
MSAEPSSIAAARSHSMPSMVLPAILDMRAVRALKASLDDMFATPGSCQINGEAVARLSTGSIQVLAAFFNTMASAKRTVVLVRPSPALTEGFKSLGLSSFYNLCRLES